MQRNDVCPRHVSLHNTESLIRCKLTQRLNTKNAAANVVQMFVEAEWR
jgi:hypothetical protein